MKRIVITLAFSLWILTLAAQDKFTDPRDGNVYRTITVAGVTWMAENLKYKPEEGGAFYFDNDPNNVSKYGILYEWKTAIKVCPSGWHLPAGAEFRTLMSHFEADEAWRNSKSGPSFRIQLAGMQDREGTFTELDESAYYWTATEYGETDAEYFSYMVYDGNSVPDLSRKDDVQEIHGSEKNNKYSVRCVKDAL